MNDKIKGFIDFRLSTPGLESREQLVLILAKLSLTAVPVAWMVRFTTDKKDELCLNYGQALELIEEHGHSRSYLIPLYTTFKVEIVSLDGPLHLRILRRARTNKSH